MKTMQLKQIAAIVKGKLHGADQTITAINTDTRQLQPGDLFIALSGKNFDGNQFVAAAEQKGAAAAIVSEQQACAIPQIIVADTRLALAELARHHRQQFKIPVIGLTGSCGKTTTKAMVAAILKNCDETLYSEQSFNNDIGVPLTLLNLTDQHRYAVIELGTNHVGEIAYVTNIAQPTVAGILNVAAVHLAGFGSVDAIADEKADIYRGMAKEGIAFLNVDDVYAEQWRQIIGKRQIITFGLQKPADIMASHVVITQQGYVGFHLHTPVGDCDVQLQLLGEHNVSNALAATAASLAVGIQLSAIKQGLESFIPVDRRLECFPGLHGALIINDAYNANPTAVRAAIKVLAHHEGKRILVLADMAELGDNASDFHRAIGEEARQQGIDALYTYGNLSENITKAFGAEAKHYADKKALVDDLRAVLAPDVTVLVKGSKGFKMWEVANGLVATGG